nr:na(+)/h(+) antiporter 2 [Quercus suber]
MSGRIASKVTRGVSAPLLDPAHRIPLQSLLSRVYGKPVELHLTQVSSPSHNAELLADHTRQFLTNRINTARRGVMDATKKAVLPTERAVTAMRQAKQLAPSVVPGAAITKSSAWGRHRVGSNTILRDLKLSQVSSVYVETGGRLSKRMTANRSARKSARRGLDSKSAGFLLRGWKKVHHHSAQSAGKRRVGSFNVRVDLGHTTFRHPGPGNGWANLKLLNALESFSPEVSNSATTQSSTNMPTLQVVDFNIVCATLGGFITVFGLVSYLMKEKFYLGEALISTLAGVVFSPHATNLIRPLRYANDNEIDLEIITLYFTRLVLGVQLVLAGVQLPSKYLQKEWKSLSLLLGPGMCLMWISTSLLVWALVPDINILVALAVGASVTPTDPVLSNSIVKGKFADKNVPPPLQKIIIAESGSNDGLGYPFLFLPLYLFKYTSIYGIGLAGGGGKAIGLWFYETWAYTILLSVAYGALVGWLAKELLHWAEERKYVDRESFLVFAITLAGNAFTWDDWFRLETEDDSLQPTVDMLLNVSIFIWFGAVCPWHSFVSNDVIPIYRLIPLGILVLLLRRLPMVLAFHKKIPQIEQFRHALFVGFFGKLIWHKHLAYYTLTGTLGPIGVSAIFYLYITREFLRGIEVEGAAAGEVAKFGEIMNVVIWFLAVCSILVHGLSIPLGKVGFYLPRTISIALSSGQVSRSHSQARDDRIPALNEQSDAAPNREGHEDTDTSFWITRTVLSVWKQLTSAIRRVQGVPDDSNKHPVSDSVSGGKLVISDPLNARPIGHAIGNTVRSNDPELGDVDGSKVRSESPSASWMQSAGVSGSATPIGTGTWQRSIRFPDESTI